MSGILTSPNIITRPSVWLPPKGVLAQRELARIERHAQPHHGVYPGNFTPGFPAAFGMGQEQASDASGISFVGYDTDTAINSGTTTCSLQALTTGGYGSGGDALEDDLVVAFVASGSSGPETNNITTSGYTDLHSNLTVSDSTDTNLKSEYKFMGATPDTTVVGTAGGGTFVASTMIAFVFRGVDTGTPLDGVAVVTATGANTVLANPGSITPVTSGAWIVAIGAGGHVAGTQTFSHTEYAFDVSLGENDTKDSTGAMSIKDDWTSGAFDAGAYSFSTSDNSGYSWCSATFVLRPA